MIDYTQASLLLQGHYRGELGYKRSDHYGQLVEITTVEQQQAPSKALVAEGQSQKLIDPEIVTIEAQ